MLTSYKQRVSVLFNEPKLLKSRYVLDLESHRDVSVLFNEPKLLKSPAVRSLRRSASGFSALQRAEIAEINDLDGYVVNYLRGFSALQRAEIAEIRTVRTSALCSGVGFSALQRAEIAEIVVIKLSAVDAARFQCSSTSRNC